MEKFHNAKTKQVIELTMKQLIETIVKPLVDFPENVHVDVKEDDNRVTYQLIC